MGHVILAERGIPGEHYVLGSENLEWRDIHSLIAELAGLPGPSTIAGRTSCLLAATVEEWRAKVELSMNLEKRRILDSRSWSGPEPVGRQPSLR
jgi:dihydroflavonol-4-reductase